MIAIENLRMTFREGFIPRKVEALKGISLHVERGEIFGFLGPNGAGKTTTIKILLDLLKPTAGRALIDGIPTTRPEARQKLGYLPDQPYFYDYLTGPEFLNYCARLSGVPRTERADRVAATLRRVGLRSDRKRYLRKYSRGMLQRIGMAQALLHDPDLLIFDEPMTGLDPIGRREFKDLFLELKEQGKTIFFSSHILQDAETLCDRVGILVAGEMISVGSLESIAHRHVRFTEIHAHYPDAQSARQHWSDHAAATVFGATVRIMVPVEDQVQPTIDTILGTGGTLKVVLPHRESLEDLFLRQVQSHTAATAQPMDTPA